MMFAGAKTTGARRRVAWMTGAFGRFHRLAYDDQVPVLAALVSGSPVRSSVSVGGEGRLLQAADFHGVIGYLADAARHEEIALSTGARRQAFEQGLAETFGGRLLRREIAELSPLLEATCEAPPLLIKGPAVAERLYPKPELRPFRDLDFMIPHARLNAAARALEDALGYRRLPEPWPGYGERHGHHIALRRRAGASSLVVELHWRITSDPVARRLDHRQLRAHSELLALDGAQALVPTIELQMLLLACHLLHEDKKRLAWINDLHLAARAASAPQWETAFLQAEELGLAWVLHRALDYAEHHLKLDRRRPGEPGPAPPWGPLRANETFRGWFAWQLGQLSLGGWRSKQGYLRSAIRARRHLLLDQLRRQATRDLDFRDR